MGLFDLFKKKEIKEAHKKDFKEEAATLVDEPKKTEPNFEESTFSPTREEILKQIVYDFQSKYQEIANTLYKNLLSIHPEALRLYNEKNIKIYHVFFNEKYYNYNEYLLFVYKIDANMKFSKVDLTDEKYYEYDTPVFDKDVEEIFAEAISDISYKDIIYSHHIFEARISVVKKGMYGANSEEVSQILSKEAKDFNKHNNYPQEYYAKNAARYAYSELDLIPIIEKVNNDDFSYQIDQAIAAYDNSLYLPACATLGVCLETVCKLLLIKNELKMKDSESTLLDKLGEKLKEKNIITYKLKGRIDVCYKVRNLAAHTSPGKVVKSDCHFILNTISEIVEEYF